MATQNHGSKARWGQDSQVTELQYLRRLRVDSPEGVFVLEVHFCPLYADNIIKCVKQFSYKAWYITGNPFEVDWSWKRKSHLLYSAAAAHPQNRYVHLNPRYFYVGSSSWAYSQLSAILFMITITWKELHYSFKTVNAIFQVKWMRFVISASKFKNLRVK